MKLQLTPITDAEVERRVANLRRHRDAATDAFLVSLSAAHNPMLDAMGTDAEVTARAVVDALTAVDVAEKVYAAKVAADAVVDLYNAATLTPPPPVVRLVAHELPATDKGRGRRDTRYRVTLDGETLVDSTTHPLADGAAVLWLLHGLDDLTPVSLRYAGMLYDRHGPMRLEAAAAHGVKRLRDRTRLREMRQDAA